MTAWDELDDGVYRRRYDFLDLNVGVVIGLTGVAVIDTRATMEEGRELITHVKELTDLPIRWVVNTHWHWDHTFGNQVFADATIYGHVECRRMLEDHGERARNHLATRIGADRRQEIEDVVIRPPEIAFANSIQVDLGGRTLTGSHRGRGHTRSDIMVTLSDSDVVFAGDLLEESGPPAMAESYPLSWPETLDAFAPVLGGSVVPGHGDVMKPAAVETQRQELAAFAEFAQDAYRSGVPLDQVNVGAGPFPETTMREGLRQAYRQLDRGD